MRYPEFLKPNETIGFIAPSFGANTEPYRTCFDAAVAKFQSLGYHTQLGPNVYKGDGIGISSSPENCGKELMEMYLSPENQCLISAGGGELMCEVLDYVDFEKLGKATPKWYLGYSDNTNFSFLSATLSDTAAFYCPCASTFGMSTWDESVTDAYHLLTGENLRVHGYDKWQKEENKKQSGPCDPFYLTEDTRLVFENWDQTPISGRFIGGCLDVLANLVGTRFDRVQQFTKQYQDEGIIWFLEACDMNVFMIRRALWQLKEAGWFQHAKAFVFGRPLHFGESFLGLDQYNAVTGILDSLQVPLILDSDIGHLSPVMPLINGGYGTLTPYREHNIQIQFKLQ